MNGKEIKKGLILITEFIACLVIVISNIVYFKEVTANRAFYYTVGDYVVGIKEKSNVMVLSDNTIEISIKGKDNSEIKYSVKVNNKGNRISEKNIYVDIENEMLVVRIMDDEGNQLYVHRS